MMVLIAYTNEIYLDRDFTNRLMLLWLMLICLLYPLIYDSAQLVKTGFEYFEDPWNYLDLAHIWLGITNVFLQRFEPNILAFHSQLVMSLVALIAMVKTFFYLRISKGVSALVAMLSQCMIDLKGFLLSFVIIIVLFSQCLAILDIGNLRFSDDPSERA